MKVCDSWLAMWTKPELNKDQMIHQFTMAGLEVDECELAAPHFEGVVVAEVIETKRHPEADKLTVCQVDNGIEVVQIVCGASNVRPGLKVALAKPGAKLPNDIKIGEAKLRGEMSYGMLCSTVELGCAENSDGIWELPKDAPVGEDFRKYLHLDEHIFSFELTPNRGDCFSAQGLARELAAITGSDYKPQSITEVSASHDETLNINVLNPEWNPLYCGRIIKNIKPHTASPLWLKEKVRRIGLRSVHPVVDVLNYVMFLFGQPMHAFDCHKIGNLIEVREAKAGEQITLLNGKEVKLTEGTPLITNGKRPIAIAGVMGSEDSAVDDDSSIIFLESAYFDLVKLSGVARSYGLTSDASMRYERGVDPSLASLALEFATEMLVSVVGGEPGLVQVIRSEEHIPAKKAISFNPDLFKKRTGVSLDFLSMKTFLERLHFEVNATSDIWRVEVPSHRFDIFQDVDLVEEILRLYGYENIPSIAIEGVLQAGKIDTTENTIRLYSQALKNLGYQEAINYAFVDPKIQAMLFPNDKPIQLLNPISPELAEMRVSLLPGLLGRLLYNINRQQNAMQLFESGVIFSGTALEPKETAVMAGLLYGSIQTMNWCCEDKSFDFYDAKGHIEHLLAAQGFNNIQFEQVEKDGLHPGQTAFISLNGAYIGYVGVLHPKLQHHFDISQPVILWELQLSQFSHLSRPRYQGLSKFPQTRRDISFLIDQKITADAILTAVKTALSSDVLKEVKIFDVYKSEDLEKGMVSIAIACIFQDLHKTLVEDDILSYQSAILKVLSNEFSIKLRDGQ
jgi:phenylalanyl-tRNA synthetase beta chain